MMKTPMSTPARVAIATVLAALGFAALLAWGCPNVDALLAPTTCNDFGLSFHGSSCQSNECGLAVPVISVGLGAVYLIYVATILGSASNPLAD